MKSALLSIITSIFSMNSSRTIKSYSWLNPKLKPLDESEVLPWPRIWVSKEEARKLWPVQKSYNEQMKETEQQLIKEAYDMSGECDKCGEHIVDCDCPCTPINHPKHYQGAKYEVIDIIEDFNLNFCLGNAIKYILRAGKKGDRVEDLRKAIWYLTREINNG